MRANSVVSGHVRSTDGKCSVRIANQLHNNVVPGFKIITFKCIRDYAISIFLLDNRCLASFCCEYNMDLHKWFKPTPHTSQSNTPSNTQSNAAANTLSEGPRQPRNITFPSSMFG